MNTMELTRPVFRRVIERNSVSVSCEHSGTRWNIGEIFEHRGALNFLPNATNTFGDEAAFHAYKWMQDHAPIIRAELSGSPCYSGRLVEPEHSRERIIVERGSRDEVIAKTRAAAKESGWDWIIELRRYTDDEDQPFETLAHWSSVSGDRPP